MTLDTANILAALAVVAGAAERVFEGRAEVDDVELEASINLLDDAQTVAYVVRWSTEDHSGLERIYWSESPEHAGILAARAILTALEHRRRNAGAVSAHPASGGLFFGQLLNDSLSCPAQGSTGTITWTGEEDGDG